MRRSKLSSSLPKFGKSIAAKAPASVKNASKALAPIKSVKTGNALGKASIKNVKTAGKTADKPVKPVQVAPTTGLKAVATAVASDRAPDKKSSDDDLLKKESDIDQKTPNVLLMKKGYELVKPFHHRIESWHDDSYDAGPIPVATRRWSRKDGWRRHKSFWMVVIAFIIAVILILGLLVVGVYFMIVHQTQQDDKGALDTRLKTKTSVCRASYDSRQSQCVYEFHDQYPDICTGDLCGLLEWKFSYDPATGIGSIDEINESPPMLLSGQTTYADCGYLNWCNRIGECVPSGLSPDAWWAVGDSPFIELPKWVNVSRETQTPCLTPTDSAAALWKNIREWYQSQCNTSVCANRAIKHGIQMHIMHCDLESDTRTGWRHKKCDGSPVQFHKCGKCANFDGDKEDELRKCPNEAEEKSDASMKCVVECGGREKAVPDGARCGKNKAGVCALGKCYYTGHADEDGDD